jgi:LysR family carnitine catabolism transcriptional activator
MNLSARQLRAFVALAHERSFTRAASACSLSQPAFSELIRQLEESVGTRLFDRTTRRVELTAEGQEFHAGALRVLEDIDAMLATVRDRVERKRGRVSIALLPSLAADWLPSVLAEFRAAYPGIDVQVADVLSEPCVGLVRGGQADFAFAAVRADTSELRAEAFCSDEFFLVCPKSHPASRLRDPKPRDLAEWPFIHLSRTSSVRQYIEAATHPQPLRPVLEVDQLATVAGMVRAGLGISIVPALALYAFQDPGIVTRPIRWSGLTRRIYVLRRRDRVLSEAAQALYDFVLERKPKPRVIPSARPR